MSLQVAVVTFATPASTGAQTQTVTGVVDLNGDAFIPAAILFVGSGVANTLHNYYHHSLGFDNGSDYQRSTASDTILTFGFKGSGTGASSDQSLLDYSATALFGGVNYRYGHVTDLRSGEFDIHYDLQSSITNESHIAICFGGDDVSYKIHQVEGSGVGTTSPVVGFEPAAVIIKKQALNSGGTATGAGGLDIGLGWAAQDSEQMCAITGTCDVNGPNARYQQTAYAWQGINNIGISAPVLGTASEITGYSATGFTATQGGNLSAHGYLAVGGDLVVAAAGSFLQSTSIGEQVIDTGINPKVVLLMGTGLTSGAAIDILTAQICYGFMNGTVSASHWTGESSAGVPVKGVRYLSNSANGTVLRFTNTVNSTSTTFNAIATAGTIDEEEGTFSVNWTTVDATEREILWLAIGEAIAPPTPPVPNDVSEGVTTQWALNRFDMRTRFEETM